MRPRKFRGNSGYIRVEYEEPRRAPPGVLAGARLTGNFRGPGLVTTPLIFVVIFVNYELMLFLSLSLSL